MFRFVIPDPAMSLGEQVGHLRAQGDAFVRSDALRELFSLLGVDRYSIGAAFDGRRTPDGRVRETQELGRSERLESRRDELYPLLSELGFLSINKPIRKECSRVVVLGGSLDACARRTCCAARWASDSTRFVDGLSCFRPISPREREQANVSSVCETEFGALSEYFASTFHLDPASSHDDFCGDRNLNAVSCVRTFGANAGEGEGSRAFSCRVFAAPSTLPGLRRADTGDSVLFYLHRGEPAAEEPLLVITDNRHCNRQFLQIAYQLMRAACPLPFDIVGCTPDERVVSRERYDPFQFVQDLIGILDWIDRINTEL